MFTLAKSKPIISSTKDLKSQYFEFTICSQLGLGFVPGEGSFFNGNGTKRNETIKKKYERRPAQGSSSWGMKVLKQANCLFKFF